jgi:hypothetical protein
MFIKIFTAISAILLVGSFVFGSSAHQIIFSIWFVGGLICDTIVFTNKK